MTNKVTARITVKVSTGDVFRTHWREETADIAEEVTEFLSRISEMTKFEIEDEDGRTVYINPAHIVYAYLEIDEEI